MKIIDRRCGWQVEGMHLATLKADEPLSAAEMLAYYQITPDGKHYDELIAPTKYDRVVILKPTGAMVIVPMNPDTYLVMEN